MSGPGYRRPDDVAEVVESTLVYVARLPDGPILVLEGSAALIWVAALESPRDDLVEDVAMRSGADAHAIRAEVETFLADLVTRRLLIPTA